MRTKSVSRRRRGVITVLVAVCLVAVLAAVALSIDAGRLMAARRQAKAVADAAARAAAIEMLDMEAGSKPDASLSTVRQSALDAAEANGYLNDGQESIVTVNTPPQQGEYLNANGYVEVIIQSRLQRGFSRIFGSAPLSVAGRSVAAGTFIPTQGSVIVLNPSKRSALAMGKGTSQLKVAGDIFVNSQHSKSPISIQRSAQIEADNMFLAGDLGKREFQAVSQGLTGELHIRVPPVDDPFAGLPIPETGPTRKLSDFMTVVGGVERYELQPGRYTEPLKFDGNDQVTMAPGTYFLDGKGLEMKDASTLSGLGVTVYSAGKKELRFQSAGDVTLIPPTSGPYSGVSVFQDARARGRISLRKDANLNIQGAIYAPNSLVRFQAADADLGDEDDESVWDDLDEDLDDSFAGADSTSQGSFGGNIVAGMLKVDKNSTVTIKGANLRVLRPFLGLVE